GAGACGDRFGHLRTVHGDAPRALEGAFGRAQCVAAGSDGAAADDTEKAGRGREGPSLGRISVEDTHVMSRITDIRGREIIDSRGNPTVEADVILDSGV